MTQTTLENPRHSISGALTIVETAEDIEAMVDRVSLPPDLRDACRDIAARLRAEAQL